MSLSQHAVQYSTAYLMYVHWATTSFHLGCLSQSSGSYTLLWAQAFPMNFPSLQLPDSHFSINNFQLTVASSQTHFVPFIVMYSLQLWQIMLCKSDKPVFKSELALHCKKEQNIRNNPDGNQDLAKRQLMCIPREHCGTVNHRPPPSVDTGMGHMTQACQRNPGGSWPQWLVQGWIWQI